jgi:hypothetical protein
MTDWTAVKAADFAVPAERPLTELIGELTEELCSSDPVRRDSLAYSILATWIDRGVLPAEQQRELGDLMAGRFADSRIQARTFAPLILDCLVTKGYYRPQWLDAFAQWYPTEPDIRGWDANLGWLHAVAHGADLLSAFGSCTQTEPAKLLGIAAARLTAATDHVLVDFEDDRLGLAVARVLTRPELTTEQATGWLGPVTEILALPPGSKGIPPVVSNAVRTLRVLYLLADRGVRPDWNAETPAVPIQHRAAVKDALAAALSAVAGYAG